MPSHELFEFMAQISDEMAAEYSRISARAGGDPGTAGDEGEENWAQLLRDWLPSIYPLVTKGQILNTKGDLSRQVDVLVLRPSYPEKLLNKKKYLAAGVLTAFECKLTLQAEHVTTAVERAAKIRSLLPERFGTPYCELHSPIAYGLLAHSHSWKAESSKPIENIERALLEAYVAKVIHPRQMLDFICASDLATWAASRTAFFGPKTLPWTADLAKVYGENGSAFTAYMCASKLSDQHAGFTPIGVLIGRLLYKMGWEYSDLRPIADYFREAGILGTGGGKTRFWPISIYSEPVGNRIKNGGLRGSFSWDEWNHVFF